MCVGVLVSDVAPEITAGLPIAASVSAQGDGGLVNVGRDGTGTLSIIRSNLTGIAAQARARMA